MSVYESEKFSVERARNLEVGQTISLLDAQDLDIVEYLDFSALQMSTLIADPEKSDDSDMWNLRIHDLVMDDVFTVTYDGDELFIVLT